jgi:hypothetical protein
MKTLGLFAVLSCMFCSSCGLTRAERLAKERTPTKLNRAWTGEAVVSSEQAEEIARLHFGAPAGTRYYVGDRGSHWLVSKSYYREVDLRANGIFINKETGAVEGGN